jgi:aldose 1-epimerase
MSTSTYRIVDSRIAGYPTTTLVSAAGTLEATFAPALGMICCSLQHRGAELLGQRGGLAKYATNGSTMGIPLLHPWANRLSGLSYTVGTRSVTLDPTSPRLHHDANGLPMHGLLAAYPGWRVTRCAADDTGARLSALLDFAADDELLATFPFPHSVSIDVELQRSTLAIATTLQATGDCAVPVSFGYHPYVQLPGTSRAGWHVELPVRRQWLLDEHMIPTGTTQPVSIAPGPLGDRVFDALFDGFTQPARFVLAGGPRRIVVEFREGYDYAQVYAPSGDAFICFEPMTAPTNALIAGGPALRLVPPGQQYRAVFAIGIES